MALGLIGIWILLAACTLAVSKMLASGRPFWSLAHFTAHLAAAVRRNLPLGQAIEVYAADLPLLATAAKRAMLRTIAWEVDNGRPLSEVMGAYPGVFPEPYRALVRAGERSGNLGGVLGQLRALSDLDDTTARQVGAAALYPAMLAMLVAFPGLLVGIKIVPMFYMVFAEMDLPKIPGTGDLLSMVGIVAPLLAILLAAVLVGWLCWSVGLHLVDQLVPRARAWMAALRWRAPLFSRYERRRAAGCYALTAGKLLEAGVPDVEALIIAAGASGSVRFEVLARRAAARVAEGQPLSAALAAEDAREELAPELLWHVRLGEAAGDLPAALSRAAECSLARARSALRGLVDLIFPAGVVGVAVVVWLMVYSVFWSYRAVLEALYACAY